MSLFVGCIDRDVGRATLTARLMLASLKRRSYPCSQVASTAPAAFGASGLSRCYISLDRERGLLAVADTRLSNGRALRQSLGCEPEASDADLILSGYAIWGRELPCRLYGDFAFAIWDSRRGALFASRDPLGVKALYYAISRETLLVSNEVEPLVGQIDREAIDEEMVSDYLLTSFCQQRRTFFKQIQRLQPGHDLTIDLGRATQRRYFFPPTAQVKFAKTSDYYDEFYRLLKQSVGDCLDSSTPIVAHLSGGLDSTSIVLLAAEIYAAEPNSRPPLVTASAVYPNLDCDESDIIDETCSRIPFRSERWLGTEANWKSIEQPCVAWPGSPYGLSGGSTGDLSIASRAGARVILSGAGGDELTHAGGVFRDLAAHGRWATLLRETLGTHRFQRRQRWTYLADSLIGIAPARLVQWRRRYAASRAPAPSWFGPRLQAAWSRRSDVVEEPTSLTFMSWTQRTTWTNLMRVTAGMPADYRGHYAAEGGVEMRFPFLDRRLVEFVLSVGYEPRLPAGYMRRLQWERLRDKLPSSYFKRRWVGSAASGRVHAGRCGFSLYRDVIDGAEWRAGPYVDRMAVRTLLVRTYDAGVGATDVSRTWGAIHRVATLEAWLRAVSRYNFPMHAEGQLCH